MDGTSVVVGVAIGAVALRLMQWSSARAIVKGQIGDEAHLHATPGDPGAQPPAIRVGDLDR